MIIPSLKQIEVDVVSVVPKMVVTERCKSYSFASGNEVRFTTYDIGVGPLKSSPVRKHIKVNK